MDITHRLLLVASAALLISACGSADPNSMHHVTVSVANAGFNADLNVGDETGSVTISSAQIVLSRLKLHDDACIDDDANDVDDGDETSGAPAVQADEPDDEHDEENENEDDEGCPPLKVGPVVVDLPLDGATAVVLDAFVPAGTYKRLQARLHAVRQGGEGVADFLTTHPELEGISVRVVGVFTDAGGTDHEFTFTSSMNVVTAINFDEPVTVGDGTTNLTINVDAGSWFSTPAHPVLDPTAAANQRAIEQNIRRSLRAFEG
jgi:hypothetical protein